MIATSDGLSGEQVTEGADPDPRWLDREERAMYQAILGRDPDAGGFAFWTGLGSAGLGQMVDSFMTSPEAVASRKHHARPGQAAPVAAVEMMASITHAKTNP